MGIFDLLSSKRKAKKALKKFRFNLDNIQREENGEERIKSLEDKMKDKLSVIYPRFRKNFEPKNRYERIFKRGTKENNIYRLIRNYVLLEIFGFLLFTIFALQYSNNPDRVGTYVSSALHIFAGVLILFPSLMKLIVIYVYRCIANKTSTIILLIIVAMTFEVPAMNTTRNIASVAETVSCISEIVGGNAKDVRDSAQSKIDELPDSAIARMIQKVSKSMDSLQEVLRKLDDTVTKLTETIKEHYEAISDITKQCERSFLTPYRKCISAFYNGYSSCRYNTPFGPCERIQRTDWLCDTGKMIGGSVCSFPSVVKSGITEGLVPFLRKGAEPAIDMFKDTIAYKVASVGINGIKNYKQFEIEYNETSSGEDLIATKLHKKLKKKIKEELKLYSNFLNTLSYIVHYIFLPCNLLYPFINTCIFVYKFNTREEYKNVLITKEFHKIDEDSALKGYIRILPLTSIEKEKYRSVWVWKMNVKEKGKYAFRLAIIFLSMAFPTLFILIDICVYEILWAAYLIIDSVHLDMPDHYEIKVTGNGTIAKLMNGVLEVFQPVTDAVLDTNSRWRSCFKEPSPPDYGTVILIYSLFILCIILSRLQIWMNRGTIVIANAFYQHRIRPRALHLYFNILEHRQNLLDSILQLKNIDIGSQRMHGHERIVRRSMQSRGLLRVNCTKCSKTDMRVADTNNIRACIQCSSFYCIECFSFLGLCISCKSNMQIVDGIELYYEKHEDDINTNDIILEKIVKTKEEIINKS